MLKKIGEITPFCFTPSATVKRVKMMLPQRTNICQKQNSLIMNNPRAPSATYMLQGIHMHIATHILNKILQYVCVGILHYTT